MFAAAPAPASAAPWTLGSTNFPAAFFISADLILFCFAYSSSKYPIAPGVFVTWPETPSLPFAPMPTGQLTEPEAPILVFQAGLTAERYDVKMNVVPLPSERCTTATGVLGSVTPGLRDAMAGSFHALIVPR